MPTRQGICTDGTVQVCFQGLTGLILFMGIYRQGHPALWAFSVKTTGGMCMQALTVVQNLLDCRLMPGLTYHRQTTVGSSASNVV